MDVQDVVANTPLACFTCGTRLPSVKMRQYLFRVYTLGQDPKDVLTELSLVNLCCRTTFTTAPGIEEYAVQAALKSVPPDETGYKMLFPPPPARAPAPAPAEAHRVESRRRVAEPVSTSGKIPYPTRYPYNVYVTPIKGTSDVVKGFTIYGPEDLEAVRAYENERDKKWRRPSLLVKDERPNTTKAQIDAEDAIADEIVRLKYMAKDLQTEGRRYAGNPEKYKQLKQQYEEVKSALTTALRRYGTVPPTTVPGTPFESERL